MTNSLTAKAGTFKDEKKTFLQTTLGIGTTVLVIAVVAYIASKAWKKGQK